MLLFYQILFVCYTISSSCLIIFIAFYFLLSSHINRNLYLSTMHHCFILLTRVQILLSICAASLCCFGFCIVKVNVFSSWICGKKLFVNCCYQRYVNISFNIVFIIYGSSVQNKIKVFMNLKNALSFSVLFISFFVHSPSNFPKITIKSNFLCYQV